MKHIFLLFFFFSFTLTALAQEVVIDTNYYTPPAQRRHVLTADPEQRSGYSRPQQSRFSRKRSTDVELIKQLKEVQTWYVAAEGGFRSDISTMDNSFNGLVNNVTQTKAFWGVVLGYTYRNAWAVETGYTWSPIHLNITIPNGGNPLIFNYQNSGHGLPLRIKRRIGSGSNSSGFWVTAGAWLIPNGSVQLDNFRLIGYSSRNRGTRTDTLRLDNNTTSASHVTGLAEVGVDYSLRITPFVGIGFYLRKYWGLGTSLRSDIRYTVNNASEQTAHLTADGTGWGFGVSLRYIYGRQHDLNK